MAPSLPFDPAEIPSPRPPAAPRLGDDCWFLAGPTAAGKTAIGIDMAARLGAEVVSVDSMAVYRGLDIGTAKPTLAERAAVRHHIVDLVPPAEPYSLARWLADAAVAVADCRARGRAILFVGGTPLYFRALRDGLAPLPAADPAVRQQLHDLAEREGAASLHRRLLTVDPETASRLHPNDVKRVVRALEVIHVTGLPMARALRPTSNPAFEPRLMIVDVPRPLLRTRIDRRVERMFAEGLVEETRRALATPGGIGPTARQAAGYAEAIELLAGRLGYQEAVARTQQRSRQLAKRQLTWLRSFRDAVWIGA
jgi:tRNA dimethylallyltransferase